VVSVDTAAVVSVAAADGMAATVSVSASPAEASARPPAIAEKTTAPLTAPANSALQQVVQPPVASSAHITTTPAAKRPKTAPPEGAVRASERSSVVARRKNAHIPQLDGQCSQSDSSFDSQPTPTRYPISQIHGNCPPTSYAAAAAIGADSALTPAPPPAPTPGYVLCFKCKMRNHHSIFKWCWLCKVKYS
jgi:hypothetical protein